VALDGGQKCLSVIVYCRARSASQPFGSDVSKAFKVASIDIVGTRTREQAVELKNEKDRGRHREGA
jgi:hypothetical protein